MLRKIIENPKEKKVSINTFNVQEDLFPLNSSEELQDKRAVILNFQEFCYKFVRYGHWKTHQELWKNGFYEGNDFSYHYVFSNRWNEEIQIINDYLKSIGKPFQVEQLKPTGLSFERLAFRLVNHNK